MIKTIPIILAGGSGTRLWPLSRSQYPKQFLPLINENETMFQNTLLRVASFPNMEPPIVVCHEDHRFIVAEQLRQIGVKAKAIILEPAPKNTAPAIALAALYVKQFFSTAALWIMPADHHIKNQEALLQAYQHAQPAISSGYLITFGIKTQAPKTAYGYIKVSEKLNTGVFKIEQFIEKPNEIDALTFVKSSSYYWNSGIFAFQAETYLEQLTAFEPVMAHACLSSMKKASIDSDFLRPDAASLAKCPANSIDYAVMEKTTRSAMAILHSTWNDLGSWDALMQEQTKDEHGNVIMGDVLTESVTNSYLRTSHGLLAVTGVNDHVIVVTDDVVLVANKDHCQQVKQLVQTLTANNRSEANWHVNVHRPWGSYHTLAEGKSFKVKKIIVNPKQCLSLQRHQHRSEHWVIIRGVASVINGEQSFTLTANQSTFIPPQTKHRLSNEEEQLLELIEVQVGEHLSENDIERFSDSYGRVSKFLYNSA